MLDLGAVGQIGGAEARIPVVRWREDGELREVRTHSPATHVARLVAAGDGIEPDGVEIVRPTLEDVYLRLIAGREAASGTDSTHPGEGVAA
jgi:ABC-2 type transport system ATP-binding protein